MSGKNLTYTYKIRDLRGESTLSAHDFPLIIGRGTQAHIIISSLPEDDDTAYIGLSQGHPFVQPKEQSAAPILFNNEPLKESVWLFHDDILTIGSAQIHVFVHKETVLFEVTDREAFSLETAQPETGQEIEPLHFRSSLKRGRKRRSPKKILSWLTGAVFFLLLATAFAWLITSYSTVHIDIKPNPDALTFDKDPFIPSLGSYYLLRSGTYTLKIDKQGYHPLEETITITEELKQAFAFSMEKLPGFLTVRAHKEGSPSSSVKGVSIFIDGKKIGKTPLKKVKVKAGKIKVEIRAKHYHDSEKIVDIRGKGETQSLTFALKTALGNVTIRSEPKGADVFIDGRQKGKTPLNLKLPPGTYKLKVSADRYESYTKRFTVKANKPLVLDTINLKLKKGRLALSSSPSGASVAVGEKYVGKTPLDMSLSSDETHHIRISKKGYEKVERQVQVSAGDKERMSIELIPIKGIVRLSVEPEDAELFINGKSQGRVKKELRLIAVTHEIEVRKKGYMSSKRTVTPDPQSVKELKFFLVSEQKQEEKTSQTGKKEPEQKRPLTKGSLKGTIKASNDYRLLLIRPSSTFTMGSSRRQQGRRSNETMRKVLFKRPFYMGTREVTNKEFRQFRRSHHSGDFKGYSLNRDEQPVVQVTWQEAAQFCNWLSQKDSLPPAYVKSGNKLVAAQPLTTGYRLPTEAEWEYCARYRGGKADLKYTWGETFPPREVSVNIADKSARTLLQSVIDAYDDGFPAAAPVGVFIPNSLGLYDMGGNSAEWCHDLYTIYPHNASEIYTDPAGPRTGNHRVVRGSSWKNSSISMLRTAYRDYKSDKREDIGFRIGRYAEP